MNIDWCISTGVLASLACDLSGYYCVFRRLNKSVLSVNPTFKWIKKVVYHELSKTYSPRDIEELLHMYQQWLLHITMSGGYRSCVFFSEDHLGQL